MEPAVGVEPTTDGLQNRCKVFLAYFRHALIYSMQVVGNDVKHLL